MTRKAVLINQVYGTLCKDLVLAFADQFEAVNVFTGKCEPSLKPSHQHVHFDYQIPYNRHSLLTRFVTWFLFTVQCFFRLVFRPSQDEVWVCFSNPPFAPLLLGLLAKRRKVPFFIVVYDLYPEVLVQTGLLRDGSWLIRWWQAVNKKIFNDACGIVTLSEAMCESISVYLTRGKKDGIFVVPNWADTQYIRPGFASKNADKDHAENGKKVVLYAGNMGLTHDLETVIEAATLLKARQDLVFVFCGDGAKKDKIECMAVQRQLANVRFLPYQDAQSFPALLASADFGMVTLGKGAEGLSVPSKTYSALAAGQCIVGISSVNSPLQALIEGYRLGENFEPGDAAAVARFLEKVLNNPLELSAYQQAAYRASKNFTPLNAARYPQIVKDVLWALQESVMSQ